VIQTDLVSSRGQVQQRERVGRDQNNAQYEMEDIVDDQVLVSYGTKYGGTAEIAEKIGQALRQAGQRVDVHPADRVSDLGAYKAVVLGSGVYIGRWRKEAARFLKANEDLLAGRPVWLFSSGPTGEGDPVALTDGWRLPRALQPIADRIQPRDVAVFHGVVDVDKLNFIEKWMLKNVQSPVGDFRDWEAIAAWATAIAAELEEAGQGSSAQPE
jgi:menaquinone-dependent protoporphyrinogen oxidase